jgi:hypothetical protein
MLAHDTVLKRPRAIIATGNDTVQYTYFAQKIWRVEPFSSVLWAWGMTRHARSEAWAK